MLVNWGRVVVDTTRDMLTRNLCLPLSIFLSQSYNMGGMGCGNGVVAINLLRDLLQVRVGLVCVSCGFV